MPQGGRSGRGHRRPAMMTWGVPHIDLPPLPGIAALLAAHPQTAGPLNNLAETLLRGPSPLTPGTAGGHRRVRVAPHECAFCAADARRRGAATRPRRPVRTPLIGALFAIAEKVRLDGRSVTADDIDQARAAGADDRAIHDTVLIAAAFSMFNRYVDGLGNARPGRSSPLRTARPTPSPSTATCRPRGRHNRNLLSRAWSECAASASPRDVAAESDAMAVASIRFLSIFVRGTAPKHVVQRWESAMRRYITETPVPTRLAAGSPRRAAARGRCAGSALGPAAAHHRRQADRPACT